MTSQIAQINMIKQQLRTNEVLNDKILDLFDAIPRDDFVPVEFREFAYSDMQIPLAHGQRMLNPMEEGKILQALNLFSDQVVLEIGTGTGFFTALLSRLCKKVISIDYYEDFINCAKHKLKTHHCDNVDLITGDAHRGWPEKAPYHVMVFTAAIEKISEAEKMQILPGGKIFAIEGQDPIMQGNLYQLELSGNWKKELVFETSIPNLIDKSKPKEFVF